MKLFPLLLLLLALPLTALARFVPPDETKVLFQRDLLPIDTDTMRVLSAQLTELALRDHQHKPAQLRATAQLLAIATRLDPVNHRARAIGQRLIEDQPVNPAKPAALRRAKSETWHLVDWLLHKEAGAEGQLLGNQVLDALRVIDPKHPSAARHQAKGEPARWNGVVASLDEFRLKKAPEPKPGTPESEENTPDDPNPADDSPPITLRSTSLQTPFLISGQPFLDDPQIAPLSLTIKKREPGTRFEFDFRPELKSSLSDKIRARIRAPLLTRWKALPRGNTAVISSGKQGYSSRNGTALSGPAALLVHAALSGKALRDDLVFLGEPREDGSLVSPAGVWDLLIALRQGPGGRLLVPPDLQEHLEALLVFGEPDFFVKYEVLLVSSLDSALAYGTSGGDPEELAGASTQFQDLRRIAASKDVALLAANTHVRSRLTAIIQAFPHHFSARMLLLQGSNRRPTQLKMPSLRQALLHGLAPLDLVLQTESDKRSAALLETSSEEARKRLDPLAPLLEIKHRPLQKEAVYLANSLRTLARRHKREISPDFPKPRIRLTEIKANYTRFLISIGVEVPAPPNPASPNQKNRPTPKN